MRLCALTAMFNHHDAPEILKNYHAFAAATAFQGLDLRVIEMVMDEDQPVIPDSLVVRGDRATCMFWQREQLINILVRSLPADYDAVAWVDADLIFTDDWQELVCKELEQHDVVQCFGLIERLDYEGNVTEKLRSSGRDIRKGHTGYAWAARREFFDTIGGLFPWDIFGGADSRMRWAFYGQQPPKPKSIFSPAMKALWIEWTARVHAVMRNQFGCVPTTIQHMPHGSMKGRKYADRMKMAAKFKYSPHADLRVDDQDVFHLTDNNPAMKKWLQDWLHGYHEEPTDKQE